MVIRRRDACKEKQKTMYDVEYIYVFFEVNKCSDPR